MIVLIMKGRVDKYMSEGTGETNNRVTDNITEDQE